MWHNLMISITNLEFALYGIRQQSFPRKSLKIYSAYQHCSHTSWYTWALSYPPTGTWPCIGEVAHMMGRRTSSDLRCSLYIHCDLGGKPMLGISSAIVTAASVKQEKLWRASSLPFLQGYLMRSNGRQMLAKIWFVLFLQLGMGSRPSLMTSVNIVEFDPQLVPFGKGHIPQKIRAHSSCKSFGAICEGPRTSQDKRHIVIIIRYSYVLTFFLVQRNILLISYVVRSEI